VSTATANAAGSGAGANAGTSAADARLRYVLRLADTSLVLGQRLGEWIGHAPAIEEDLGLANTSLDLIGQARLLLTYAGELEGRGRSEDDLAFLREEHEFYNVALVEQPNGDFGHTIVRQFLVDAWQCELYEALCASKDERLAQVAAKALKETLYHVRYSGGWVARLGDGTDESHARVQTALEILWPYTAELFDPDAIDAEMLAQGVGPDLAVLRPKWLARVDAVLAEATLKRPPDVRPIRYGKRGEHGESLGRMLAEMQSLHRAHPGAKW
jgi:ring-1,2-phenylacetyl-CoA epoxidase subunit PaaC